MGWTVREEQEGSRKEEGGWPSHTDPSPFAQRLAASVPPRPECRFSRIKLPRTEKVMLLFFSCWGSHFLGICLAGVYRMLRSQEVLRSSSQVMVPSTVQPKEESKIWSDGTECLL